MTIEEIILVVKKIKKIMNEIDKFGRNRKFNVADSVINSPVPWCSGYHVCFTRRRSRVRSSPEPGAFVSEKIESSRVYSVYSIVVVCSIYRKIKLVYTIQTGAVLIYILSIHFC